MNLADLLYAAQGGAAMRNLASFYGLTPQQAESAVNAFLPAFSIGLKKQVEEPALFPGFARMIGGDQGLPFFEAFTNPQEAMRQGQAVLAQLFGSEEAGRQVAQQAAVMTGLGTDVMREMLPAVASIVAGGLAKAAAEQGVKAYFAQFMPPPAPRPEPVAPPVEFPNPWQQMAQAMTPPWLQPPPPPKPAPEERDLPQLGVAALARLFETGRDIQDRHMAAMQQIVDAFVGARTGSGTAGSAEAGDTAGAPSGERGP